MTGLEGTVIGRSICPERFRIASTRVYIDRGDPESQVANSLLPDGPVIICFIIP